MNDKRDHDGANDKLAKAPPHFIVMPIPELVAFPGATASVYMRRKKTADLLGTARTFVVVHDPSGLKGGVPIIGTLATVDPKKIKRITTSTGLVIYKVPISFTRRMNLTGVISKGSSSEEMKAKLEWRELMSEDISEKEWNAKEFQTSLVRFKTALLEMLTYLYSLARMASEESHKTMPETSEQAREMRIDFENSSKMINAASKDLKKIDRLSIGAFIDRAAGLLSVSLYNFTPPGEMDSELIYDLEQLLWSVKVKERFQLMSKIVGPVNNLLAGMNDEAPSGLAPAEKGSGEMPDDDKLPEEVRKTIKDLLKYSNGNGPEAKNDNKYIDWLRGLFAMRPTEDEKDFSKVRQILDEDHDGLEKVKEIILEFLAVRNTKSDAKAPLLCLVGPPGVGKTSLGKSIARATGRKFIRRSLGGVKDEADLRGHRRTYIGALPGMILAGLREAGTNNPVFMLDEVDKLGEHGKDVPEHVLLEIFDPEQNYAFRDHYTEIPFDLSQVLFIGTANTTESIQSALENRMEIIKLPGYTEDEKMRILRRHIIEKAKRDMGIEVENLRAKKLPAFDVKFTDAALKTIVGEYAHDAGMRDSERAIRKILRKILLGVREGKFEELAANGNGENGENGHGNGAEEKTDQPSDPKCIRITPRNLKRYLGKARRPQWMPDLSKPKPGVGTCLVVYGNGRGGVVFVEVSTRSANRFDRKNTGHLSEVMDESVNVAMSRLLHDNGVLEGLSHKMFIHTHFDEGATPKDGPSAGVMIFAALYSCLIEKPIKPYLAATGEITLERDVVLPIGGVQEKLLGARRAGIREVVIPNANKEDLESLPMADVRIITPEDLRDGKSWKQFSKEPKAEGSFTVYCIEKPEDLLEIALPDDYPANMDALPEKYKKKEPKT